jgi:hypothetical protein
MGCMGCVHTAPASMYAVCQIIRVASIVTECTVTSNHKEGGKGPNSGFSRFYWDDFEPHLNPNWEKDIHNPRLRGKWVLWRSLLCCISKPVLDPKWKYLGLPALEHSCRV